MPPSKPVSCVPVFDMGGVLIDWNPRYLFRNFFDGNSQGVERFLDEIDFWNWNAGMDRGQPFAEGVAAWSARFPQYANLIRAFDARWEETAGGPIPGMADILLRLRRAGHPLYGLSNSSTEKFRTLRSRFPFLNDFSRIVLSGEVGVNKPDPRIFDLFLDRTGRRKEELLFIDDTEANISAARRLGWQSIRFLSAEQLERELAERGFALMNR